LREASHPSGGASSASRRFVVVVARNQPSLFEDLRRKLSGDPAVRVLLDRRRAVADRPWPGPERRRGTDLDHDLRFRWAVVCPEQAPESTGGGERTHTRHEGGAERMSETERSEVRQQIERWIEESQGMLGRTIPGLLDDNERLRAKIAAAEEDCDRMRMEIGQLRREIAELQKEVGELQGERQYLRGEQAVIAEAVSRALHHMSQLTQSMNEILQRIHVAEPVPVDGATDRG